MGGIKIEDGAGQGNTAKVNNKNELKVRAVTVSSEHEANHQSGLAYNANVTVTPSGGDSCIVYVKNLNINRDLIVEGIWIYAEADEYFDLYLNDTGSPTNVTEFTPVNLNTNSNIVAIGDFYQGSDIQGLVRGNKFMRIHHANSKESIYRNFNQDVVLGPNGVLTVISENSGGVEVNINFPIHYLDKSD